MDLGLFSAKGLYRVRSIIAIVINRQDIQHNSIIYKKNEIEIKVRKLIDLIMGQAKQEKPSYWNS